VTDVVVSLEYYHADATTEGATGNLSCYFVLNISHRIVGVILIETRVRFFDTQCRSTAVTFFQRELFRCPASVSANSQ